MVADSSVMKLYVFNEVLYVGTLNFLSGARLLANTDEAGLDFAQVFDGGFENRNNLYVWQMQDFHGRLYVGTFKLQFDGSTGFDLISSSDPTDPDSWVYETDNGFDTDTHYGIRTFAVYEGQLMIGSAVATVEDSCKVWEAAFIDRSEDEE